MMKKIIFIILSTFIFSSYTSATPQMADLLIYKGDTLSVYYSMLSKYIYNNPQEDTFINKNRESFISCTCCWRGYYTISEIRNDSLFLLKAYGEDKKVLDLSMLFGKSTDFFASWSSDTLIYPENNLIYIHDDWGGYYEYETDFIIEKGILKKVEKYHNDIQPSIFCSSNTDTTMNFIKANINYNNVKPVKEKIRVSTLIEDVDDNGKISKVSVRGKHEDYYEEAIRVVKSIPKWQVIKRRGKKIHIYWYLPVIFEPQKTNSVHQPPIKE